MSILTGQQVSVILVCAMFLYTLKEILDVLKRIEKTLDEILDGQTDANKRREATR
jgi:hypothetical protein